MEIGQYRLPNHIGITSLLGALVQVGFFEVLVLRYLAGAKLTASAGMVRIGT